MSRSIIKPEWVPNAYLDKKSNDPVVKTDAVEHSLYHRKDIVSKYGFKRRQVK